MSAPFPVLSPKAHRYCFVPVWETFSLATDRNETVPALDGVF